MTDLTLADLTNSAAHPPWAHQEAAFAWWGDRRFAALAMEQRTGKTRVVIGKAVDLFRRGEIRGLLVVAMPGDVHVNWVTDELPAWLPPDLPYLAHAWRASKTHLRATKDALEALIRTDRLSVLTVNGEALITETFRRYLGQWLKARGAVMAVADEQTLIMKSPFSKRRGSRRSKVMMSLARLPQAAVKVIMDGTPVGEGPFDLYTPYEFLKPGGQLLGTRTWTEFKTRYAEYEDGYDPRTGKHFPKLTGYQNLDGLHALMARHTFRVLRRECLDLPEKVYVPPHRFELSKEQRRVYDALRDEYVAEFAEGLPLNAANVLTRYLRLQQVASNYVPAVKGLALCPACLGDGCEACDDLGALEATVPARRVDQLHHPRLEALEEVLRAAREPVVIWARFRQDVDDVMSLCDRLVLEPVRYDGGCNPDEKLEARQVFQRGGSQALVGSARAGGRGLRLSAAGSIHYYSNEWPLLVRLQSEDRAEAPGKPRGTGIHDYLAEDTVDDLIVAALRGKRGVADVILNEKSGSWI